VVNSSSSSGIIGAAGRTSDHATKHAIIGLTTNAALEYAERGIRVNAICPGTIDTPMMATLVERGELDREQAITKMPINRIAKPEEVAAVVLWLCSPGA